MISSWLKNTVICLLVIVLVFILCTAAERLDTESGEKHSIRFFQHESAVAPAPDSYKDGGAFNTHLPLVCIDTDGVKIPGTTILDALGSPIGFELSEGGESTIPAHISIYQKDGVYHSPEGPADIEEGIQIRVRGNTSRLFDKKSYKLNFYDKEGLELPVNIMGMGMHDEWALYGPFLDKTLLRNYLFLNLCGQIEPYTSDVRFCEVMLNGEYQGLYVMMETIAYGNDRVQLTPSSTRRDKTSYIVRLDMQAEEYREINSFTYYTKNMEPKAKIAILYPGKDNLTEQFRNFIEDDFSAFEKALYSYDFKDANRGYRAYIDVQSFVDYYIVCEFLLINDMCNRSTYLYKDLAGKIVMGPAWDFNNVANNFLLPVGDAEGIGFYYAERTWFKMLLKDDYFVERVIRTYREMRNGGILDEEKMLKYIDDIVLFLGDSIDRNYQLWGYSFDYNNLDNNNRLRPLERNPHNYEEALSQLKDVLIMRGHWLDENIENLRQYCHPSAIKQFVD